MDIKTDKLLSQFIVVLDQKVILPELYKSYEKSLLFTTHDKTYCLVYKGSIGCLTMDRAGSFHNFLVIDQVMSEQEKYLKVIFPWMCQIDNDIKIGPDRTKINITEDELKQRKVFRCKCNIYHPEHSCMCGAERQLDQYDRELTKHYSSMPKSETYKVHKIDINKLPRYIYLYFDNKVDVYSERM